MLTIFSSAALLGSMIPLLGILPFGFGALLIEIGVISLIGIIVGFLALKSASEGDFHKAGVMGIIASFLPPLDLIMLIGGILCLISEEAE